MPRQVALIVTMLALAALPAAASATTWNWSAPVGLAGKNARLSPSQQAGIACPSTSLCVAFDANGDVYTTRTPSRGAAAWKR